MAIKSHARRKEQFLDERARQIFEDLGYTVSSTGETLKAERDGKHVQIAFLSTDATGLCPYQWEDDKYCFITRMEEVEEVITAAEQLAPSESDWVVMGVDDSEYRIYEKP